MSAKLDPRSSTQASRVALRCGAKEPGDRAQRETPEAWKGLASTAWPWERQSAWEGRDRNARAATTST